MAIILKRGLEANRASTAVAEGEMLFSRDTGRLYIGSGSSNIGGQEINFNNLTASAILVQNSESISRITLLSHGTVANADSIFVGRVASGTPTSASSTLQGHYTAWQMQTWGTSSWSTTARMMMQAAENHNDASRPTNIIFSTVASGSTTLGDRFKINGIGVQVTGSLGVTGAITASQLLGTSSYSVMAATASFFIGSFISASIISASNLYVDSLDARFTTMSVDQLNVTTLINGSASYAITASHAIAAFQAVTASYVSLTNISASLVTASNLYAPTIVGSTITTVSNGDLTINPNGTGSILVRGARAATGDPAGTIKFRSDTTTSGKNPVYVIGVTRQNSNTAAWYLGVDGNDDAVFSTNGANMRIGRDQSGTFNEYLNISNGVTSGSSATFTTMSVDRLNVSTIANLTSSYALTASYALNGGSGGGSTTASYFAGSYVSASVVSASRFYADTLDFTIATMSVNQLNVTTISSSVISASALYVDAVVFNALTMSVDTLTVNVLIRDSYGNVRAVPQNWQPSAYTMSLSDIGRHIFTTSSIQIPPSIFSTGDVSMIVNSGSSNISIETGSGVSFVLAGTTFTGNRTLTNYGMASVTCVAPNLFYLSGTGLS